jgi:hypothetical protein
MWEFGNLTIAAGMAALMLALPRAQQTDNKKWDVTADLGPTP